MIINFNEHNWPYFDDLKAISPSKLCQVLNYLIYDKVPEKALKYAINRGNQLESGFYEYFKHKDKGHETALRMAISKCNDKFKKKQLINLIHWFNKKLPNAQVINYQRTAYKYPYACILDFEFRFKENGQVYVLEMKTNNREKINELNKITWDIQCYLQQYCTNQKVYFIWLFSEGKYKDKKPKQINYEWKMPNYDLLGLIKELDFVNGLDWDIKEKAEYIKEWLEENYYGKKNK